ncbi:MAG TPA: DNA primase [Chitinivibrionales bacterium]|jgi:DNA primase|nr:DNA primase [Chitinivibrionales bacterium]
MAPGPNLQRQFDDGVKEEIRSAINIADVVGRHVALKPAGQNLKGLCPFHKEKTPSFTVSPAKGIYYCFGCHKGGDVFNFLMELEGLTFPEALRLLADEAGIKIAPRARDSSFAPPPGEEPAQGFPSKDELFTVNRLALDFYYRQTRNFPPAIDYFVSRGLSKETIREFRLGYAPPGWTAFLDFAKQHGAADTLVARAGLAIVKADTGGMYDRFRDRIIFPIFDSAKRPVGFAGRGLTADAMPKYLNSPETPLYRKSSILYGFHVTHQHVREKKSVIIVEGYMDFLALYQAGIKNVIASSGTAFTDTHARTLRRFTDTIFLVFDGDAAGVEAARRAIFVLAPYNFNIRVLTIPDDEDPDDFVKAKGARAFAELLEKSSKDYMDFMLDKIAKDYDTTSPSGKIAVIEILAPLVKMFSDSIVRRKFMTLIVERLSLSPDIVFNKILISEPKHSPIESYFGSIEGYFFHYLIANPFLIPEARQFVQPETLTDQFSSKLYSMILKSFEENDRLETLLGNVDDEAIRLVSYAFAHNVPSDNIKEDFIHIMKRLQEKFLQQKIRDCTERMKKEPGTGAALLEQVKEYSLQLKALSGQ